jgi:mRNA-degrading endonuclease RelE of RelBE toxin-antitoxin system
MPLCARTTLTLYTSLPYSKGCVIAEVVSLSGYESQVSVLLSEDERIAMEFFIACAPESHPVIQGTGGFRKARWAGRGKGKSGGFRVIYFFLAEPGRIYMAAIYAKSRQETISAADQKVLARVAARIKKAAKGGR